jgi:hypothetical protein
MPLVNDPSMVGSPKYERVAHEEYLTPAWCVEALLDAVGHIYDHGWWDPAAGKIKQPIVEACRKYGITTVASDIQEGKDFLKYDTLPDLGHLKEVRTIITNPPFNQARQFIDHALNLFQKNNVTDWRVYMLLRNEYDCAKSRKYLFGDNKHFAGKFVLTKRPYWFEHKIASPRHNYAWFWWARFHNGPPTLDYVP